MALIVETGLNVPNANSYLSVADARALALAMGIPLAGTDPEVEAALARAVTYLEGFRAKFQGHTTNGQAQPLAWPRNLVTVDNTLIASNVIPLLLKKAQVAAANLIQTGIDLLAAQDGRIVISEKVDVLETKWSDKVFSTSDGQTQFPEVSGYLLPLLAEELRPPSRLQRY